MKTWFMLSVLVVLGFIIVESLVIRSHRATRNKIDFFYTLHRIMVQKQRLRIEDVIAFSGFLFFACLVILVVTTKLQVNIGTEAEAQVSLSPKVAQQIINDSLDGSSVLDAGDIQLEESPWVLLDHVPERRYEEYVFDVQPARIVQKPMVLEAESFILPVGKKVLDEQASGGVVVQAKSQSNVLGDLAVSDPHTLQKAGEYKVFFKMKFSDNTLSDVVARLEIWDEHEGLILFEKEVYGYDFKTLDEYLYIEGRYMREAVGSVQVKVIYMGIGDLSFDKVEISPVKIESREYDMNLFYSDVPDVEASESLVRLAKKGRDIPGRIAFGPYDDSVEGAYYRAKFRMKVSDNQSHKKIALIDVSSDNPDFSPSYRDVYADDFNESGVFQEFSLDFLKGEGGYLEFRVYYYGVTDLYFDRVDLHLLKPRL